MKKQLISTFNFWFLILISFYLINNINLTNQESQKNIKTTIKLKKSTQQQSNNKFTENNKLVFNVDNLKPIEQKPNNMCNKSVYDNDNYDYSDENYNFKPCGRPILVNMNSISYADRRLNEERVINETRKLLLARLNLTHEPPAFQLNQNQLNFLDEVSNQFRTETKFKYGQVRKTKYDKNSQQARSLKTMVEADGKYYFSLCFEFFAFLIA